MALGAIRQSGARHLRRGICAVFLAAMATVLPAQEASLRVPGGSDALADRLRAASTVLFAREAGLTTPQEILAAALADYRTLVQVLYDAGHFSPRVRIRLDGREAADIPLVTPPGRVREIEIEITPGPVFRFGRARVAPLAPGTELPEGFAAGHPASTGILRDAALAGQNGWRDDGHAKAAIGAQRIIANHTRARLDADITLIPGPRLRFGKLIVSGESQVNETAIQRIARLPTGAVYSPETLRKVGTRLRRTGAFSTVALREAETPNADGTLDLTVQVADQPPRRITFGGELASRTGLTLSATWLHRNLFGNAERLRLDGEVRNIGGEDDIDGKFSARLDLPARLGPDDNLFYLAEVERIERQHYDLDRAALAVGVRRVKSSTLTYEAMLMASHADANDAYGARRFRLLSLPLRAIRDKRDSVSDATSGYYFNVSVTPFAGFGGSASGVAAQLDARGYRPLTADGGVVLAARLQIGSVAGAGLTEVSPEFLFFSGGSGTVRGQPYESLGIPVGTATAGGRSMLTASAELRARVSDKFALVGFFDYGMIDTGSFVGSGAHSHSGAGIGLRYDLGGFGPLRLDLALPVDGDTGDGLQFYIGIGQAF